MTDLQIFMNAPRNATAEELRSYLDKACGDDASLRARVESLFHADEAANEFMNHPAVELNEEAPSIVIGRYKLLQEIGQGGFGVVYMADQEEPVKRRVALKIIKAGMDTRQVIARFEAERQALAMLDHANIARVLDGGQTDQGRPYFAWNWSRAFRLRPIVNRNGCQSQPASSSLSRCAVPYSTLTARASSTAISSQRPS